MEANPIDVHRAVDAGLVALDALAPRHPDLLLVATTNYAEALDPALASRADMVVQVPLPDLTARRAILGRTLGALTAAFPGTPS
jgi:SpoVK/Ycf46/Vps4 family AAA+-type ATPase